MPTKKLESPAEPIEQRSATDALAEVVLQVRRRETEADRWKAARTAELKASLADLSEQLEVNAKAFSQVQPRAQKIIDAFKSLNFTAQRIPPTQTKLEREIFEELKQLAGAVTKTPAMIVEARTWLAELNSDLWRTAELAKKKFQTMVQPIGDAARVVAMHSERLERLAHQYAQAAGTPSREAREVPPDQLVAHLHERGVGERDHGERVLSDVLKR